MTENTAWGVMICASRKPFIYAQTYRTRKEAKADYLSWWGDTKMAEKHLRNKRYRIVKVRIEVIE